MTDILLTFPANNNHKRKHWPVTRACDRYKGFYFCMLRQHLWHMVELSVVYHRWRKTTADTGTWAWARPAPTYSYRVQKAVNCCKKDLVSDGPIDNPRQPLSVRPFGLEMNLGIERGMTVYGTDLDADLMSIIVAFFAICVAFSLVSRH